ncbi:MAG: hypothetical protein MJ222_00235 [Bacilli bacterium]|nr:hypothetical protein [Bacilli bacterium]
MDAKKKITRNSISIMGGICFILLALVTMLSDKTPFAFLSIAITTSLGFVGFWILMPFLIILGLFLIFKKKLIKFKVGMSLWGAFVMIVCFVILSSHWATIGITYDGRVFDGISFTDSKANYLTFSNSLGILAQIRAESSSPFNPQLGGGYVGFIIAGSINTALTPIGMNAICWIFFIGGLVLLLNHQVKALILLIKKKIAEKKAKKNSDEYEEITSESSEEEDIIAPIPEQVSAPVSEVAPVREEKAIQKSPFPEGFAPVRTLDSGLKKAVFTLSDEVVIDDSMVKKADEAPASEPALSTISEARFGEIAPEEPKVEEAPAIEEPFVAPVIEEEKPVVEEPYIEETFEEKPNFVEEIVPEEPAPAVETQAEMLLRGQPKANLCKDYIYPPLDLLDIHEAADDVNKNEESCAERTALINQVFEQFRVGAEIVSHTVGPSVTRYDIMLKPGVSVNLVRKYVDDISIRLGGIPVRFEAIVSGKSTSGIEIPNEIRTNVGLREAIAALPTGPKYLLNIPFGKGIGGDLRHASMGDFPHMLVSGTTGSGKSIAVHSTILTLLMRNKPEELKIILVDPKKVEMSFYEDIPHLLCPIITDMRKTYNCLKKLVDEMERRYNLFQAHKLRDIKGFNAWASENDVQPLPYIAVFVDEYADLVEQVKEVHEPIQRLVQKARAAGIHICIATQRPSVNVIDGVIKSNFTTRLALLSASATDSQTIIGEGGAEKLLGHGDMLIDSPLISVSTKPRVQGCYVSENEVNRVCDFLREHYSTQYDPYFLDLEDHEQEFSKGSSNEPPVEAIDKNASEEAQYQDIKDQVMHREYCSISFIQRSFAMGFPRAGRIFARLQKEGIVAFEGDSRGNKVLAHAATSEPQMGTIEQSTFIPDDPSGGNGEGGSEF